MLIQASGCRPARSRTIRQGFIKKKIGENEASTAWSPTSPPRDRAVGGLLQADRRNPACVRPERGRTRSRSSRQAFHARPPLIIQSAYSARLEADVLCRRASLGLPHHVAAPTAIARRPRGRLLRCSARRRRRSRNSSASRAQARVVIFRRSWMLFLAIADIGAEIRLPASMICLICLRRVPGNECTESTIAIARRAADRIHCGAAARQPDYRRSARCQPLAPDLHRARAPQRRAAPSTVRAIARGSLSHLRSIQAVAAERERAA